MTEELAFFLKRCASATPSSFCNRSRRSRF